MLGRSESAISRSKTFRERKYTHTATGISAESFKALLTIPNRSTLKGKRDYALLLLLWGNALRRGEVASANIEDLDLEAGTLKIRGKGQGTQVQIITLGTKAIVALSEWLKARGEMTPANLYLRALTKVIGASA